MMSFARRPGAPPALMAALLLALPVVRFAGADGPVATAAALAIGFIDLVVLPGAIVMALLTSHRTTGASLGLGIALSVAFWQIALLPMSVAAPPVLMVAAAIWSASLVGAGVLWWRASDGEAGAASTWLPALFSLAAAAAIYAQPAAIATGDGSADDVVIIRRLAYSPAPTPEAVNWASIRAVAPLPPTTFFSALIARATDLDPLIVHDKLRAFWAGAAMLVIYALARRLFGTEPLALASAGGAAALAAGGAMDPLFGPSSSGMPMLRQQVALTVLVPAAILLFLGPIAVVKDRWWGTTALASLAVLFALSVAWYADFVQVMVYGAVACVLLAAQMPTQSLRLGSMLVVFALVLIPVLTAWFPPAAWSAAEAVAHRDDVLATVLDEKWALLLPGAIRTVLGQSASLLTVYWWAALAACLGLWLPGAADSQRRFRHAIIGVLVLVSVLPIVAILYFAFFTFDVYALQARHWLLWGAVALGPLVLVLTRGVSPHIAERHAIAAAVAASLVIGMLAATGSAAKGPAAWVADDYRARTGPSAPPASLVDFARRQLDHTGRVLHHPESPVAAQALMTQRFLLWPAPTPQPDAFNARYFPGEWALLNEIRAREGEQPFFGPRQADRVRGHYAKTVEATHVLLGPQHRELLFDTFARINWLHVMFDADGWTIYEIDGARLEQAMR
jgi:hypothetical protein